MADQIAATGGLGNTIAGVANLAQLFLGTTQNTTDNRGTTTTDSGGTTTTTNSGGTTTTVNKTEAAPGAVDALIQSILSGASGLAAVAGGQRTAGLYNSSTNQLLVNDLAARAAAEGAKLTSQTTQTTTTAPTTQTSVKAPQTQTTQNTGGTSTVKPAAINPLIPAGIIGALQLTPQSAKDTIKNALGLGVKTAGAAAAANAASDPVNPDIEAIYNDPSRALDVAQGASTALDGAQNVSGIGDSNFFAGNSLADFGLSADTGEQAISSFTTASDFTGDADAGSAFDSVGIDAGGFDFSGVGESITDALGGFIGGIGDLASDTASSVADGIGSFFSDFDFGFADGGIVSGKDFKKKISDHGAKRKHFANGGVAISDLDNAGYITNTGLRREAPSLYDSTGSGGNNQDIQKAVRDAVIGAVVTKPVNTPGKPVSVAPGGTGYNSSAPVNNYSDGAESGSASTGPVGDPDAAVSGIGGALGSGVRGGASAVGSALGISGLGTIAGLATATNRGEALAALAPAALGIVSPPLGLALALGIKAVNALSPSDSGLGGAGDAANSGAAAGLGAGMGLGMGAGMGLGGVDMGFGAGISAAAAGMAANAASDMADAADADADSDSSSSDSSSSSSSSSSDTGSGTGGGNDGQGGDSSSYKSGGKVKGPGTGTSDSIPAMLSDGEYVIPADVVEALGIPFFDSLRQQFHTPVRSA